LIANSMDILVYAQILLKDPELATSGTELARNNNTKFMARLNTRDQKGNSLLKNGFSVKSAKATTWLA
jgi:hypothetical protein